MKVTKKQPKAIEKPIEKPIKKSKNMKNKHPNFSIYIYKVLKSAPEGKYRISSKTMLIMNNLVNDWLEKIAVEAGRVGAHAKKNTLTAREMCAAIRLLLPGDLAEHAHIEATKAMQLYANSRAI